MTLFEIEEQTYTNDNPKGTINREYESCVRKASYFAIVCAHWLNQCDGDPIKARNNEPLYDSPATWIDADRFKKARQRSGYWDRSRYGAKIPTLKWKEGRGWRRANRSYDLNQLCRWHIELPKGTQEPIPAVKFNASVTSPWRVAFEHWYNGGLERSIEDMLQILPEENRLRVVEEIDKF